MATTYSVMENALEYTTSKVVVIACLALSSNQECSNTFSMLHWSLDTFPLSMTKVKAIWDLLDDPVLDEAIENGTVPVGDEPRTRIGLLWDYSVYHSRWTEIGKVDFEPYQTYEKGAESFIAVTRGNLNRISLEQKMEPGTTGEQYLRRMIEDCQDRRIEVLLTYLPFPANEGQQMEEDYEEYNEMKNRNIVGRSSIEEYLMLLSGDNVDIIMDIRNKDIFNNAWIVELLGNLGINTNELAEYTDFI